MKTEKLTSKIPHVAETGEFSAIHQISTRIRPDRTPMTVFDHIERNEAAGRRNWTEAVPRKCVAEKRRLTETQLESG
jgi:hypothetical protein